jgi:hypothetical protein
VRAEAAPAALLARALPPAVRADAAAAALLAPALPAAVCSDAASAALLAHALLAAVLAGHVHLAALFRTAAKNCRKAVFVLGSAFGIRPTQLHIPTIGCANAPEDRSGYLATKTV